MLETVPVHPVDLEPLRLDPVGTDLTWAERR